MIAIGLRRSKAARDWFVGIANDHSIAFGCAGPSGQLGAELAITYLNDKARPYVEPLAQELQAPIFLPCDVQDDAQVDALFAAIRERWGRLDFALHAVAFAPKHGPSGPADRFVTRGFPDGDGHLLPFIHSTGAAHRAADDRRRDASDAQLRAAPSGWSRTTT